MSTFQYDPGANGIAMILKIFRYSVSIPNDHANFM